MLICVFVLKEWRVHDVTRNQSVYRHLGYDEYDSHSWRSKLLTFKNISFIILAI